MRCLVASTKAHPSANCSSSSRSSVGKGSSSAHIIGRTPIQPRAATLSGTTIPAGSAEADAATPATHPTGHSHTTPPPLYVRPAHDVCCLGHLQAEISQYQRHADHL